MLNRIKSTLKGALVLSAILAVAVGLIVFYYVFANFLSNFAYVMFAVPFVMGSYLLGIVMEEKAKRKMTKEQAKDYVRTFWIENPTTKGKNET